jgi:hypothetical protein
MLPLCLLDEVGLVFGNENVILIAARCYPIGQPARRLTPAAPLRFSIGLRYLPPSLISGDERELFGIAPPFRRRWPSAVANGSRCPCP